MADKRITALTETQTLDTVDLLVVSRGGNTRKMTFGDFISSLALEGGATGFNRWTTISEPGADYTADPAATDEITFGVDWSGVLQVGWPLRYKYNDTYHYGLIEAVDANSLNVRGAPLVPTTHVLQELAYGRPEMVVTQLIQTWDHSTIMTKNSFGSALSTTVLETYGVPGKIVWARPPAACVEVRATFSLGTGTSGNTPKVNLIFDTGTPTSADRILTTDSGKGLELSTTKNTFVRSGVVEIDPLTYQISPGDTIEVEITEAGSDNVRFLNMLATFVLA